MGGLRRRIEINPEEGVDRKDLKLLCRRYLQLNEGRLKRTRALLSARQQQVLDLLPLLFQVNHPLLPGYVSRDVPRGIHNYEPGTDDIRAARALTRSFDYRHEKKGPTDIRSLFLMGSTGSIAHGPHSDFDVWLCHRSGLTAAERRQLQQKADKVAEWATAQGVESHIFLIDAAEFRSRRKLAEANAEDCGTAQHFLLLDEFYRTHLWLAGAYPLWWIIPPEQESHFNELARMLVQKRFIKARDYIDFGGCPRIPSPEFVGAGMWHLYKGLDSPYKSLLKLLLVETYAREQGQAPLLSLELKQRVFADELGLDENDPYVMVYKRLSPRLKAAEAEDVLQLVRRAFYLKVGEPLGRAATGIRPAEAWRRQLLQNLVDEWGWSPEDCRNLDHHAAWRIEEVQRERRRVVSALTGSYRFLSDFASRNKLTASISARDLNLLGRKLYAVFQRKAGKLDFVNPGIAPDLREEHLALVHEQALDQEAPGNGWYLLRELPDGQQPLERLRTASGLFELLAWAHINRLLRSETGLALQPGPSAATLSEMQQLVGVLRQTLPMPLPPAPQSAFESRATVRQCLMVINAGVDPLQVLTEKGLTRISDQTDALAYSRERINLVRQVDLLVLNSWNEISVQHFESGDTLVQALKALVTWLLESGQLDATEKAPPAVVEVCCFCPSRAPYIAERVQTLWCSLEQSFRQSGPESSVRYVLQLDTRFFVLQIINRQARFTSLDSREALLAFLGQAQPVYSPWQLDPQCLPGDVLHELSRSVEAGKVNLFWASYGEEFEVYVIDEHGSIYYKLAQEEDAETYLPGLQVFLQSVWRRRQMRDELSPTATLNEEPLVIHSLSVAGRGWKATRQKQGQNREVGPFSARLDMPQIQVLGESLEGETLRARAILDEQEFFIRTGDLNSYAELAAVVRSRYRAGVPAPAAITDLSLPRGWQDENALTPRQTLHYLTLRERLQSELQQAMRELH